MKKLNKKVKKDVNIFWQDLTKHTVYTIFLIILTSLIAYFLITTTVKKILSAPATPQEELYTEKGSPYDNSTIEGDSAQVVFHGSRDKKQIALTFDAEMTDGMKANLLSGKVKSSYDKRIIDILNKTHTKATLFLTGMWIELYPDVTRELANNPLFEIGSHSYTDSSYHGYCYGLKQIPSTLAIEEIGATEKLLREHAGIDNKLFRFPGGCYTPDDVKLVSQANDLVVHWDVVGADGFNTNTQQIVNNVVNNAQNGSIIVLHMNGEPTAPKTADALAEIISKLKSKGYEFVKVNELLNIPPETRE